MNTIGINKPFNQRTFDKNDPPARQAVKQYFYDYGKTRNGKPIILIDNPKKYEPDLMTLDKSEYFEVYHCLTWLPKSILWPYPHYNLPQNKGEYATRLKVNQVAIDKEYKHIAIIGWQDTRNWVLHNGVIEVPNRMVLNGEYMYKIPAKYVKSFPLKVEMNFTLDDIPNFIGYE
jgi:hypothetical protein